MPNNVYTLLCERDYEMACRTLPLLVQFLNDQQELFILGDGSLSPSTVDSFSEISERIRVITLQERNESVLDQLQQYPNCIAYRNKFPLGYKLLDLALLNKQQANTRFIFTDSDIIYIRNCEPYFQQNRDVYLRTDQIKLSIRLQHALLKYRWKIPYKFNSGYFSYDAKKFDLDFVEYYLGLPEINNIPWLTEQTCWALLFGKLPISYYPDESQFVCQEKFEALKESTLAVHLIANLKSKVKEWSEEAKNLQNHEPEQLRFSPTKNVTLFDWGKKKLNQYVK
ncbi:MAG: putative nucleotide-diphospho-sugar transferase [Bacteroidota bacterium]